MSEEGHADVVKNRLEEVELEVVVLWEAYVVHRWLPAGAPPATA
jgi:hypothetical protein